MYACVYACVYACMYLFKLDLVKEWDSHELLVHDYTTFELWDYPKIDILKKQWGISKMTGRVKLQTHCIDNPPMYRDKLLLNKFFKIIFE